MVLYLGVSFAQQHKEEKKQFRKDKKEARLEKNIHEKNGSKSLKGHNRKEKKIADLKK